MADKPQKPGKPKVPKSRGKADSPEVRPVVPEPVEAGSAVAGTEEDTTTAGADKPKPRNRKPKACKADPPEVRPAVPEPSEATPATVGAAGDMATPEKPGEPGKPKPRNRKPKARKADPSEVRPAVPEPESPPQAGPLPAGEAGTAGPMDIKAVVDHADSPAKWKTAGTKAPGRRNPPKAKRGGIAGGSAEAPDDRSGGTVVDFTAENAARLAFEQRINNAKDFDELVYGLAVEIQGSELRKATKTNLLKQITRKSGANLDGLRELAPAPLDGRPGRGRADPEFLPYRIVGNQIFLIDDEGQRPLCNFVASIVEEVIHDNGLEEECLFRIEGRLQDGTPLPAVEVPSAKFAGLTWVTGLWGARPLIHAGQSIKDHLRTAIQGLSRDFDRRVVYGHTGWRKLGEQWAFLHGGGAIFAEGERSDLEVRVGEGHMRRYAFTAEAGGDLAADVRASLKLLELSAGNPALGVALLASVYRAPLAEAAPIDHGMFLAATTGARKSEAAAMAQAHFGRGFERQKLPANWDDSESDLEAKAHAAKDCLFVVDDFKPRGAASDVHKLHVKADRLLRAVGNQSGRGRRTSDMKQRAAFHPRGLVLATGEDIPRGASLRARVAVVELGRDDVDNAVLSELQESARTGALERAMAGYLRWLAADLDEWKRDLPGFLRAFRDRAIAEGFARSHPRAADIYGSLLIGLDAFFSFAVSAGAVDAAEKTVQFERCETALKALISAQGELQEDQDEVLQFFGFLRSCLNAGLCHFSDSLTQGAPAEHPSFWGWRLIPGTEEVPGAQKPQGKRLGWVDSERVYLDANAGIAAVQELAKATGENLAVTKLTLMKRMHERGLLLDVRKEAGKLRLSPKRVIAGVSQRVYVLGRQTMEDLST